MDVDGIEGISASRIDSMRALLRNMAEKAAAPSSLNALNNPAIAPSAAAPEGSEESTGVVNFADALKNMLNQANKIQADAQRAGEEFLRGESKLSISDMLIEKEKAHISLQLTVQTRNKLAAAYNEIMGMQI